MNVEQVQRDYFEFFGEWVSEADVRKTLNPSWSRKSARASNLDDALDELDDAVSDALRLVQGATRHQLARVPPRLKNRMLESCEQRQALLMSLLGTAPACTADSKGRQSHAVGYKTSPAGLWMHDLARKAAWDLGIPCSPVFDMREVKEGETPDIESSKVLGLCRMEPIEVFIRSDLDHETTLAILGHEMYHAWEKHHGITANEDAADAYGRQFADWVMTGVRSA